MQQNRPINNFEEFQNSVRDFESLFYPKIKGATDIDFFYERKGNFFIMEGKNANSDEIVLYYGQVMALKRLKNALGNKLTCYIIAQRSDETQKTLKKYHIIDVNQYFSWENNNGIWSTTIKINYWLNKEAFQNEIISKIQELENC